MALTREQFAKHLELGIAAVRKSTAKFCWNELPNQDRYYVILNSSYDGNPLASDEYLFPDHDLPQFDIRAPHSAAEVVARLWRDGKIPEWIDITPYQTDGSFLYSELLCCGRFTDKEAFLYHKGEGYPPFHIAGPLWPPGFSSIEQDGKFDLHWYRNSEKSSPEGGH